MAIIAAAAAQVPTYHEVLLGDARQAVLPAKSVHLILRPTLGQNSQAASARPTTVSAAP